MYVVRFYSPPPGSLNPLLIEKTPSAPRGKEFTKQDFGKSFGVNTRGDRRGRSF